MPGKVVYSVLSPEELPRDATTAPGGWIRGPRRRTVVILVQAASELQEDELGAALDAVGHAERPVILAVLGDG